jgi:hypothetical protein
MTKDVLKYLQPNAAIPIDMETTSLLVNALKKALSEHAMQEVQRLGQEIEQEYLFHQFQTSDGIWYPFLNQSLYETALADGRNPIRTLYTTPPQRTEPSQRTWVGLTDEELNQICNSLDYYGDRGLVQLIESKLKEKNT